MKKNESVRKVMTKNPITVNVITPLKEVAEIFAEQSIHHVPVIDGKKLVGLVTYNDLMRLSFAEAFGQKTEDVLQYLDKTTKISEVMTTQMTKISAEGTVKDAAEVLCQGSFHSACVVTEGGELEGIVTSTDVIKYLLDQY